VSERDIKPVFDRTPDAEWKDKENRLQIDSSAQP